MKKTNPLDGITRPSSKKPDHMALQFRNRVSLRVRGPDGKVKSEVTKEDNIMATYGLNDLIERIATGGEASDWVSAGAIGTDTAAEASTLDSLGASTQIVHLSDASMAVSDLGDRTVEYQMTFASDGNASEIHEIGLFGTNNATENMVARSELGTDSVNRGTADKIEASYQVIAGTA